jgi:peptidoglycan/xylan/chitin deacetylase (PgdA/CDA1 family)
MSSPTDPTAAPTAPIATADPAPPAPAAPRRRPFTFVTLTAGVVPALVLIGLVAAMGSARDTASPIARHATAMALLSTATTAPAGTSVPGTPASPQGCSATGAAPKPPLPLIFSARGYPGARGEVALTFDDGPAPIYTRQILDELQAAGAQATFFVVGAHAQRYPDLVRAELAGGNAVGNHSFTHQDLAGKSVADVRWQLASTSSTLRSITGDTCLWLFRPPYGLGGFDANALAEAHREGFTVVIWDVWALDWQRPGTAVIAQRIITRLHSGAIILLHDGGSNTFTPDRSQTADALPAILAAIHQRGLRAVTLPRLLTDAGLVRLSSAPAGARATPTPPAIPTVPPGSEGALAVPTAETARFPSA